MRLNRLAAGAAAAVLSLGAVSACSGDDTASSRDDASNAADPVAAGAVLTQENFAETVAAAMVDAGSVTIEMSSTGGLPIDASGVQRFGDDPADSAMSLSMNAGGMEVEFRLLDGSIYVNLGQLTQGKFAEIDLDDSSNPFADQFGDLAGQADLSEQLESFGDALTGLEKSGDPIEIDGVQAQPYALEVDAAKIAESQGADVAGMPDTMSYVMYVGSDNLVRRMSIDVMGQGLQMDFTNWGEDVTIEKPSADQITDFDFGDLTPPV